MLLHIPDMLTKEQVGKFRQVMDAADWVDGRITAGKQSYAVKDNEQLDQESQLARDLGDAVMGALSNSPTFFSAALPAKVYPPLFNRYSSRQSFGTHIDNAVRPIWKTPHKVRTDLSATLFLSEPDEYEGGELVVEDTYGTKGVKLPAGHMILYSATSMHHVTPVTRGARVASFFWIQSMVRSDEQRRLLFEMDNTIQQIAVALGHNHQTVVSLTGNYHNLLRMWAEI